jgi:hypothetical protein
LINCTEIGPVFLRSSPIHYSYLALLRVTIPKIYWVWHSARNELAPTSKQIGGGGGPRFFRSDLDPTTGVVPCRVLSFLHPFRLLFPSHPCQQVLVPWQRAIRDALHAPTRLLIGCSAARLARQNLRSVRKARKGFPGLQEVGSIRQSLGRPFQTWRQREVWLLETAEGMSISPLSIFCAFVNMGF